MIPRNSPVEWLPVGHVPPRPRIDLGALAPRADRSLGPALLDGMSIHEKNRIWQTIVEVSK